MGSKAVNTGHVGEKGDHRAQSGSTGGHRWPFGVHIGSLGAKGGPRFPLRPYSPIRGCRGP